MTNNQHKFMLLTGKYLPEENIQLYSDTYYFKKYNNKIVYYENSDGYWQKKEYNEIGNCICFEDSTGYWYKLNDGMVIGSGNYYYD